MPNLGPSPEQAELVYTPELPPDEGECAADVLERINGCPMAELTEWASEAINAATVDVDDGRYTLRCVRRHCRADSSLITFGDEAFISVLLPVCAERS